MWRMLIISILFVSVVRGQEGVLARDDGKTIILDNQVLRLTFSKSTGQMISLHRVKDSKELGSGRDTMYWDCNTSPEEKPAVMDEPNKGYWRIANPKVELIENTSQRAEVRITGGPDAWCKFAVELHWVMFKGDSGFYHYAVISHPQDQGAATMGQMRFVHKLASNGVFKIHAVQDGRLLDINTSEPVAKLMDATYRLDDGTIKTKYGQSSYWAQTPVYGFIGDGVGVFSMTASFESQNGGPVKQGQTVHDNVLLRCIQTGHFGSAGIDVKNGEAWRKVYGPFLTYVNEGKSPGEIWNDAKQRHKAEVAEWPYHWVNSPAYVKARGEVRGRFNSDSNAPAWIILAEAGTDWALQAKGYQFFTRAKSGEEFVISNVIPGKYALYISGADRPDDFVIEEVSVEANKIVEPPPITLRQDSLHTLWQIGTFDRNSAEFRNGENARQYQMFRQYHEQFPEDVHFVIGKSDASKDWNYAHWSFFNHSPKWTISFDNLRNVSGEATLTIGVASAQPAKAKRTDVIVTLNGKEIGRIQLPKTGTASYRGGTQDSPYHVIRLKFDAAMLKIGKNEVGLEHANAKPFPADDPPPGQIGHLMYDALRLQVPDE